MRDETKDDKILMASIEDKFRQCWQEYRVTNSGFLDLRQRSLAEKLCGELGKGAEEVRCRFFGGYDEAERTIALFLPDYAKETDVPLGVIRAKAPAAGRKLTHRDYLGSLTGLGIKREMLGDILVTDSGADIIVLREIQEFLLYHYGKAGRTSLSLEALPLEQLRIPQAQTTEIKDTVASLRLDNVIASAFGLSRAKASEAIRSGLVFVNSAQLEKTDFPVKEGDKLVLRGKGKAYLKEVGGKTRKDRIFITIRKFL